MPKKITQQDLVEILLGLHDVASALREAARSKPLEGYKEAVVAAKATALSRHADFLDRVVEDFTGLLPDEVLKVPES
jgi:hypothetical protein